MERQKMQLVEKMQAFGGDVRSGNGGASEKDPTDWFYTKRATTLSVCFPCRHRSHSELERSNIGPAIVFALSVLLLLLIGSIFSHAGILKGILQRRCDHQYCSSVTILVILYLGLHHCPLQ